MAGHQAGADETEQGAGRTFKKVAPAKKGEAA
jgi:hypothetical protein